MRDKNRMRAQCIIYNLPGLRDLNMEYYTKARDLWMETRTGFKPGIFHEAEKDALFELHCRTHNVLFFSNGSIVPAEVPFGDYSTPNSPFLMSKLLDIRYE